jgi:hypothetical protein
MKKVSNIDHARYTRLNVGKGSRFQGLGGNSIDLVACCSQPVDRFGGNALQLIAVVGRSVPISQGQYLRQSMIRRPSCLGKVLSCDYILICRRQRHHDIRGRTFGGNQVRRIKHKAEALNIDGISGGLSISIIGWEDDQCSKSKNTHPEQDC